MELQEDQLGVPVPRNFLGLKFPDSVVRKTWGGGAST